MKTEVYSWRVSADLKTRLEIEARRRNISVSALLDRAVQDFLAPDCLGADEEEEQRRLQSIAMKFVGVFAGSDPDRSTKVRETLRRRLRRAHGA